MSVPSRFTSTAIGVFLTVTSLQAGAAASIRASGYVDLDGDFIREYNSLEQEPAVSGDPFLRSIVSVHETQANVFEYFASCDIGALELKVFGTLNNSSANALASIELGILDARATLEDVITLESLSPDPYEVTLELHVDGLLDIAGGGARGSASLHFGPEPGLDSSDFSNYLTSGVINDTLSVTRTFTGTVMASLGAALNFRIYQIDAGAVMTGQLNNTATLRLILPENVTVAVSESGTFNQVITPVPLPAAMPLFAVAALGVFSKARRKTG
ncbi:MAG: hypothetical protein H6978_10790 [Gammaproteobacteria bacterium]|nr:hypothetical protein [Gammaproteobacteria bacterium]